MKSRLGSRRDGATCGRAARAPNAFTTSSPFLIEPFPGPFINLWACQWLWLWHRQPLPVSRNHCQCHWQCRSRWFWQRQCPGLLAVASSRRDHADASLIALFVLQQCSLPVTRRSRSLASGSASHWQGLRLSAHSVWRLWQLECSDSFILEI